MPHLSRRRILELTGAAAVLAALPVPRAFAGRASSFSQDLTAALPGGARIASTRHVLPPQRAPRRFELIGLDFGRAGHVHADVRARRRGGRWSSWARLHDATQPVWTGPADEFQVRFDGPARTLAARFVAVGRAAPRAGIARRVRAPSAAGSPPPILPRSAWRAGKAPPRGDPDYAAVQIGFVHHTVTANAYGPEDSASIVLGIARYHIDHNGWNDIGYNFLVDRYGQIFEGRGGGVDQPVLGAQAQGYNSYSTGVACLGDHSATALSADGLEAVAQLLAWKLPLHGAPVRGEVTVASQGGAANRYRTGRRVTFERISGHRDGDATSCPGEALYAQLPALRRRASRLADAFSALTVRVEEPELTFPQSAFALTGLLRFEDGAVSAGQPVQLQFRAARTRRWVPLQTVAAGPDGAFAATLTAPGSGRVRAVYPGDGVQPPLTATPVRVKLLPALTLRLAPKRPRAGRRTRVTGTVTGADVTHVTVFVHQRVSGRYYKALKRRVPVVDGAFELGFQPAVRGRFRVTVRARGGQAQRFLRATR